MKVVEMSVFDEFIRVHVAVIEMVLYDCSRACCGSRTVRATFLMKTEDPNDVYCNDTITNLGFLN